MSLSNSNYGYELRLHDTDRDGIPCEKRETYVLYDGVQRGGWCSAFIDRVEYWYPDGRVVLSSRHIPEERDPIFEREFRGRLLRFVRFTGGQTHRLKLFDRFQVIPPIAVYHATTARHIRVDHREPENFIWFYKNNLNQWVVEFGEDGNTSMRKHVVSEEGYYGILGEYTMLHDTIRGTHDTMGD